MILVKILAAWLLADLLSGVVHWLMDRKLARLGILAGVVRDNELHHARPAAMLELTPLQNLSTSLMAIPAAAALFVAGAPTILWLAVLFLLVGNLVHRYAHAPRSEVPRLARYLQRIGIFQSPAHHAKHHRLAGQLISPAASSVRFCVMTNFVNPILDWGREK